MEDPHPLRVLPTRGRGAVRNVRGRFDPWQRDLIDDGWGSVEAEPPRLLTTATPERTRSIISSNDSPDVPFDQSVNPYRGCEHGCVYCFARPTHSYLGLSPGLDFESRIFTKPEAPELLRAELNRRGYRCRPIVLGANTDAYQPLERRLRITRRLLGVLAEFRHPVSVVTKSNLVVRDLDLLGPMARQGRAAVFLSITTLDRNLAAAMEPRAATPRRRLRTLECLSRAGVPVGVMFSPVIPALNDSELERILEAASGAGARYASCLLLRLPFELKQLFEEWLREYYPGRADKVLGRLRQMRAGRLNDPRFGHRMRGGGPHAELLQRRFELACRRLGLNLSRPELDTTRFRVPPRPGDQRRLF